MASFQSKVLNSIFRMIPKEKIYSRGLSGKNKTDSKAGFPPPFIYNAVKVKMIKILDRNVVVLQPKGVIPSRHVLYLHGGAYLYGMSYLHWKFVVKLMRELNCSMMIPDYPLAPHGHAEETFALLMETYRHLLSDKNASDLLIIGDSAGGGLALALAMMLKEETLPQPRRIVLLSPWLDAELTNPEIQKLADLDLILDVEGLQNVGRVYEPDTEEKAKRISPIHGDLKGLARIVCFVGTHEIMLADARKLKERCAMEGIEMDYFEYEDMLHAWMLFGIPESREMIQRLAKLLESV